MDDHRKEGAVYGRLQEDCAAKTADMASSAYPRRDIGWAIKQMWNGQKVTRIGWNGRGMSLAIQYPDRNSKMTLPYIYMSTVHGELVPWLASQTDLLAFDWRMHEVD